MGLSGKIWPPVFFAMKSLPIEAPYTLMPASMMPGTFDSTKLKVWLRGWLYAWIVSQREMNPASTMNNWILF